MGQMANGVWESGNSVPDKGGAFDRPQSHFRQWIAGGGPHPPEPGRYHLYVSLACPWAHRALIVRALKRLEGEISLSVTHWLMGEQGWTFEPGPGVVPDPYGVHALHEVYRRADPHFTGRVTVPVLWDKQVGTIVSNESADIIRMLDQMGGDPGGLYPEALRPEIDAVNERVYGTLNNGVYAAGFARTQEAYEAAFHPLFATLDWLEARLGGTPFLCGNTVTEADWRLFTTLVRFDSVYNCHFKCNLRRIVDYPNLWDYTRSLYQVPGVAATVDFGHIKRHYYMSHPWVNPSRIVPAGPDLDWTAPGSRRPNGRS